MGMKNRDSRGFTLIAALLLTVLLSALAVGLLYTVSSEARMGGNDLEDNLAYYGAEAGIEDLTYQLSNLYSTTQNPTTASITALTNSSNYPTAISGSNISNMQYAESISWPTTNPDGTACPAPPCASWDIVGAGSNQGMVAQMIPYTLNVTATRQAGAGEVATNSAISPTGASVNLTRTVEVALLPAFEFGVFCDGDCDYFAGPNFNFGGRVHTNGNLYVASGAKLTFTDKIAVVGEIVLDRLENGHLTSSGYTGTVYAPNAGGGCPAAPGTGPATNCPLLATGSWQGGIPTSPPSPPNPVGTGSPVSGWNNGFNNYVIDGTSGATKLQLPFVQSPGNVGSIDIIRRPTPGDSPLLAASRLYGMAQIRILLADTIGDLHPERSLTQLDANDVHIYTGTASVPLTAGPSGSMYFGVATAGQGNFLTTGPPTNCSASYATSWTLFGQVTNAATACQGVWLRVEYADTANPPVWHGVTQEWLGYGFGRAYNVPPTAPYLATGSQPCPVYTSASYPPSYPGSANSLGQCYNPISPAILILQQLQQSKTVTPSSNVVGASSATNWIPINFYDAREGEPRDTRQSGATLNACSLSGVMNAVELDVGNLWLWLQHSGVYSTGHGNLVSKSGTGGGGYILYFSDRRGMVAQPVSHRLTTFYNNLSGTSNLEDTVNSSSSIGVPDAVKEGATYYAYSPEDVDGNTYMDNSGEQFLGAGFGLSGAAEQQPYYIVTQTNGIPCTGSAGSAEYNMVTGPRHALRLVDGGMDASGNSYLPHAPAGTTGSGFTVASEEPVYVWGDYNSGSADPFWPSGANPTTPHSASAIIADAVTLLSNPPSGQTAPTTNTGWTDLESFSLPNCAVSGASPDCPSGSGPTTYRPGNTSYYRVAIAAGKSIPFPQPAWGGQDFGTDGGMHNFLRYLENRGANGATVNYVGSIISMYYSQYATGNFKCCSSVYSAPVRNYFFDTQFLNPQNLPPGTPMFQDVVSLSYHQSFTPQ
jgi:hypothetical protein